MLLILLTCCQGFQMTPAQLKLTLREDCNTKVSLTVRPNKVAEAAKLLVNNGSLYKDEGITFNETNLA